MSATLPEGMASVDRSIASMRIGQSGWTVPWAMYHDDHRTLWLNGSYTLHHVQGGTIQMRVRRDESGWHIDARSCADNLWSRAGYVGGFAPIAVASFTA